MKNQNKKPEFKTKLLIEYLQTIEAQYPGSVLVDVRSGLVSKEDGAVHEHTFDFIVTDGRGFVFDETPPEVIEGYLRVIFNKMTGDMIDSKLFLTK